MLQLTRHPREGVVVGGEILIRVEPLTSHAAVQLRIMRWPPDTAGSVVTLKPGQEHRLSRHALVQLVSIDRGIARLAFDAPRSVSIDREELLTPENGS